MFCVTAGQALADQFSVEGQTYYMDLNLGNLDKQEFGISIAATPVEKEIEFKILVSPKDNKPLPTNLLCNVYVKRNDRYIMDFTNKPDKIEKGLFYRFSLRADYIPEATGQLYYYKQEKDTKRSYAVVYRFSLEDFVMPATPPAEVPPPAEAPAKEK